MKKFLVTGATGAVGSQHVPELLKRGYEVTCLVRGENPRARLERVMSEEFAKQVSVLSGDITSPLGGVSSEKVQSLRGAFDCLVHHAGSVTFDKEAEVETFAANIGGTANMLCLAEQLGIGCFCYDSSSYGTNIPPRNPYEESKAAAEQLVRNWRNGQYLILRPSIIVGDSRTGKTNAFTGYYGWFSGFAYLKHQLAKFWAQDRTSCVGFYFEEDVLVFDEPIYLDYSYQSTLNLVTIDWLVSAMTDLIEAGQRGRAYNLADPQPRRVAWIIDNSFDILGIKGVERRNGDAKPLTNPILAQAQTHMDERLSRYLPYVTVEKDFGCEAIAGAPAKVERRLLETLLHYAVETRFGHK